MTSHFGLRFSCFLGIAVLIKGPCSFGFKLASRVVWMELFDRQCSVFVRFAASVFDSCDCLRHVYDLRLLKNGCLLASSLNPCLLFAVQRVWRPSGQHVVVSSSWPEFYF